MTRVQKVISDMILLYRSIEDELSVIGLGEHSNNLEDILIQLDIELESQF